MNAQIIKDYYPIESKGMKLETLKRGLENDNWLLKGK
jgi:hypothetical protein